MSLSASLRFWMLLPAVRSTVSLTSRSARSKLTTKSTSSQRFPPQRSALSCATTTALALRSHISEQQVFLMTKPVSYSLHVGRDGPVWTASPLQSRLIALAVYSMRVIWTGPTWSTSLALFQTNLLARSFVHQMTIVLSTPIMAHKIRSIQMSVCF